MPIPTYHGGVDDGWDEPALVAGLLDDEGRVALFVLDRPRDQRRAYAHARMDDDIMNSRRHAPADLCTATLRGSRIEFATLETRAPPGRVCSGPRFAVTRWTSLVEPPDPGSTNDVHRRGPGGAPARLWAEARLSCRAEAAAVFAELCAAAEAHAASLFGTDGGADAPDADPRTVTLCLRHAHLDFARVASAVRVRSDRTTFGVVDTVSAVGPIGPLRAAAEAARARRNENYVLNTRFAPIGEWGTIVRSTNDERWVPESEVPWSTFAAHPDLTLVADGLVVRRAWILRGRSPGVGIIGASGAAFDDGAHYLYVQIDFRGTGAFMFFESRAEAELMRAHIEALIAAEDREAARWSKIWFDAALSPAALASHEGVPRLIKASPVRRLVPI